VLACDQRFASRENTLLAQFEVGTGVVPGGGPMARLPRLVGRGRALEILVVADDLDGPRAEQYGYVNRVIADDQLDHEVEAIAARLARFDHDAIARAKSYVDRVTLPPTASFRPPWPTSSRCSAYVASRSSSRGSRRSGSTPTATSNGPSGGASSHRFPTPDVGPVAGSSFGHATNWWPPSMSYVAQCGRRTDDDEGGGGRRVRGFDREPGD
jgi:Enoyl-CoA hydratase/isomerase